MKLSEELKVIGSIEDYEPWAGARPVFQKIEDESMIGELEQYLEEIYPEGYTFTDINDELWFNGEDVLKYLGLAGESEDLNEGLDDSAIKNKMEKVNKEINRVVLDESLFEEVEQKEITLSQLQDKIKQGITTMTVKDNSPRGAKDILTKDVKAGDEVVLDNHFVKVVGHNLSEQSDTNFIKMISNYLDSEIDFYELGKSDSKLIVDFIFTEDGPFMKSGLRMFKNFLDSKGIKYDELHNDEWYDDQYEGNLVSIQIDCPKNTVDESCEDEVKKYQAIVDDAINKFGRIGAALYDELDEEGLYVSEEDGKYIVKSKETEEDGNVCESHDGEKIYSVYFGTGAAWLKEFIVRAFNPEEAADKAADLAVEKGFTNLYSDFEALDELADEGQTGEEYAEANNLVPLGNNSYYFDLQRIEEYSLESLDEAKDSKVPTDLSKFKGTITKLLKDNYNEIKNLETKEEIKNKIKELLAKEKINTTASKRLVNNLEKSKNAINSMYIVTNSILAGEDAAVLGEGLITEYRHKIKVPKYNKVYDELEKLGYRVSASTEENSIQVSKKYEKNLKKAADYLDSLGIEHKTKYSPVQGRYYMTITFTPEMLDNPNDVVEESLKEDLENTPSAPEIGPDMGLASVINSAIIDELKTIDTYNDAIVSATELGNADLVAIFTEINNDEHKHVGNLQKALSLVSPQAESIPEGEKEAEEIISKVEDREETANDILNNIEEPIID